MHVYSLWQGRICGIYIILAFCSVGSGDQPQVIRLGSRHL